MLQHMTGETWSSIAFLLQKKCFISTKCKKMDVIFCNVYFQCSPFWPVTDSYNMLVKYERSNVVSQHFPFKRSHHTVLRMKNGVSGSLYCGIYHSIYPNMCIY